MLSLTAYATPIIVLRASSIKSPSHMLSRVLMTVYVKRAEEEMRRGMQKERKGAERSIPAAHASTVV